MNSTKALSIRIPKDLWVFLKKRSIQTELSMNFLIIDCLEKFKNRCDKRLTDDDTTV